jgi:hypothetical protein
MASTVREESCAMNWSSVPHQDSRPRRGTPVPRGVVAREGGLELIGRVNRGLIAAAVAAAGMFSLLAAHAFHGHTVTTGGASSSSSAASSSGSPGGPRGPLSLVARLQIDPRSNAVAGALAARPGETTEGDG